MKRIKVMTLVALAILAAACNDNDNIADIKNVKPVEIVNGQENGFDYADLGLPSGTLWATCNVGATSPEQAGLYFAWGETTGFTAEQVTGGERAFDDKSYKAKDISTNLTLEQDAAHVHMGGNWRMPTKAEFKELIGNCSVEKTYNYNGTGIKGRVFTSKVNGKTVFFPAAGKCDNSSVSRVGSYGYYWSASRYSSYYAWSLNDSSGSMYLNYNEFRYYGYSVRGVFK